MLSYYLPKPVKPHTVLHIPGSHTLFIGPSSCGRRHAFHASEYGDRKHISFLFITEADVISGDYETIIGDAIAELLEILMPEPHIFLLDVFCIDDFLGTDETALLEQLQLRFPDRRFAVEHIDPVTLMENKGKGKMKKQKSLYTFLNPVKQHDSGINFLGNFVSLEPECEFLQLLRDWKTEPVRELFHCETYEAYQDMARSRLAVGLRYVGEDTVRLMTEVLNIPYYYFPASYDVDFVARGYREIASLLGCPQPDLSQQIKAVIQDAEKTAELLADIPIAIDCSAFLMPFQGAVALLKYGFHVKYVFFKQFMMEPDDNDRKTLEILHSQVQIVRKDDYDNVNNLSDSSCLAIGTDAARLLHTSKLADIWHDEGYYGFHGIHKLMALLRKSAGIEQKPVLGTESCFETEKGE